MAGAGSGVSYSTAAGGSEKQVQVQISPGENAEEVRGGLEALRKQGWVLDGEGMGIQKTFYFRTYFKAVVSFAVLLEGLPRLIVGAELCECGCVAERDQEASSYHDCCKLVHFVFLAESGKGCEMLIGDGRFGSGRGLEVWMCIGRPIIRGDCRLKTLLWRSIVRRERS
jgi:hypothetical protein